MIGDRWRREAAMGCGYAALFCAVRGAGYEGGGFAAVYFAVVAGGLVVLARRLAGER